MKHPCFITIVWLVFMALAPAKASAQQTGKLPWAYYITMVNNCNSADIVLLQGEGGSIGIDKENFGIVKEFITDNAAPKPDAAQAASIMCLLDGKEFISGKIYVQGNTGAITFTVEGAEYSNLLSDKAVSFFKSLIASL